MKKILLFGLLLLSSTRIGVAQVSGSAGAYGNNIDPAQIERSKRQPSAAEQKDDGTATFVEASILMNVQADEYVAVFGVLQEGKTPAEANTKMNATIASFKASLQPLGIAPGAVFVDFIAQNRIYAYRLDETTAREELAGFELKKNVSIRFKDKTLIDKLAVVAAQFQIYDLIKVDYVVKNAAIIQARLQAQTMDILKNKARLYQNGLGVKLSAPTQVTIDKPSIYFPVDQYSSYTAAEAENINVPLYDRSRLVVQSARKSRTTYFKPLSGDGFDRVINPNSIEPVVQFTTYIKVKYQASKPAGKQTKSGCKTFPARRPRNAALLRFNGLYVSPLTTKVYEDNSTISYREYLRFYPDGTVLSESSTGAPWEVAFSLTKGNVYLSRGVYHLRSSRLSFETRTGETVQPTGDVPKKKRSVVRVSYKGTIQKKGNALKLFSRSYINGHKDITTYTFVPVKLP